MLSFKEYLFESQGHGLTMFDIDDTLFTTDNKVHVVKGGQTIRKLNAAEFNMYKRGPGEQYDYTISANTLQTVLDGETIKRYDAFYELLIAFIVGLAMIVLVRYLAYWII